MQGLRKNKCPIRATILPRRRRSTPKALDLNGRLDWGDQGDLAPMFRAFADHTAGAACAKAP